MHLLITGASGFLGRNVLRGCPKDWRVLAVYHRDGSFPAFLAGAGPRSAEAARCDLRERGAVEALFERYGREWDACLHLSAKVDIPWSVREPEEDLAANAGPLLHVLDNIRARKFIYFSSGAVYDGLAGEVHPGERIAPTLPYAISKLACERYVECYRERKHSMEDFLVVRFFGAYGPYEAAHKIYTRLVRAFALEGKSEYTIYGDGRNLIDAMWVGDAVEAVFRMLGGGHWNDTVNLAGGRPVAIEDLVREAGRALGLAAVRIRKEGVAHESNRFWGSTREMKEFYGFEPATPFEEGIGRLRDFLTAGETVAAAWGRAVE